MPGHARTTCQSAIERGFPSKKARRERHTLLVTKCGKDLQDEGGGSIEQDDMRCGGLRLVQQSRVAMDHLMRNPKALRQQVFC